MIACEHDMLFSMHLKTSSGRDVTLFSTTSLRNLWFVRANERRTLFFLGTWLVCVCFEFFFRPAHPHLIASLATAYQAVVLRG